MKTQSTELTALGITQTIVSDKLTQLYEKRYQRVQRGTKSSLWLIANAREKADLANEPNHKITSKDADWVKPPRPANCGAPLGNLVDVHLAQNETIEIFLMDFWFSRNVKISCPSQGRIQDFRDIVVGIVLELLCS